MVLLPEQLLQPLFSLLNNKIIKKDVAITGEINLQGRVTAIGGLELKILGGMSWC